MSWTTIISGAKTYCIRTDAVQRLGVLLAEYAHQSMSVGVICDWIIHHTEARMPNNDKVALVHVNNSGTCFRAYFKGDIISIDRIYHRHVVPGWIPCILHLDIEAIDTFNDELGSRYPDKSLIESMKYFVSDSVLGFNGISDDWESVRIEKTHNFDEFALTAR